MTMFPLGITSMTMAVSRASKAPIFSTAVAPPKVSVFCERTPGRVVNASGPAKSSSW